MRSRPKLRPSTPPAERQGHRLGQAGAGRRSRVPRLDRPSKQCAMRRSTACARTSRRRRSCEEKPSKRGEGKAKPRGKPAKRRQGRAGDQGTLRAMTDRRASSPIPTSCSGPRTAYQAGPARLLRAGLAAHAAASSSTGRSAWCARRTASPAMRFFQKHASPGMHEAIAPR